MLNLSVLCSVVKLAFINFVITQVSPSIALSYQSYAIKWRESSLQINNRASGENILWCTFSRL